MTATADRGDVPRVDSNGTKHERPGLTGGPLVLIGGNCTPHGHALRAFLEAAQALDGGTIVGITTASGDPVESAQYWAGAFTQAGVRRALFPPFDRNDPASDAAVAAAIDGATGVFMGGGDQVKLVASLTGTETEKALKALHARGGAVCGTSAGAAAISELTMAGGELDVEGNLVEQYIGPGLGLLGHQAIIDTHFSQRRRLQRLFLVVASNTELFGIGIDEDTALVVTDDIGEVKGAGGVTFVDGRDTVRFDNADDLDAGRQLTLSHLRVGIVGTGYHLNIRERELQELLDNPRGRRVKSRAAVPASRR
jgi:cyanophycinase